MWTFWTWIFLAATMHFAGCWLITFLVLTDPKGRAAIAKYSDHDWNVFMAMLFVWEIWLPCRLCLCLKAGWSTARNRLAGWVDQKLY